MIGSRFSLASFNRFISCGNAMCCGAQINAVIYGVTVAARSNSLNVYYYIRHLLTELMKLNDTDGNIGQTKLELLMSWSKCLSAKYYSKNKVSDLTLTTLPCFKYSIKLASSRSYN